MDFLFHIAMGLLALGALLAFLKNKPFVGTALFGLATGFHLFAAFAFAPTLLFFEKSLKKRITHLAIFTLILVAMRLFAPNQASSAVPALNMAALLGSAITVALTSSLLPQPTTKAAAAIFVFTTGAILPFLFLPWQPAALTLCLPTIWATSFLSRKRKRNALIDFGGLFALTAFLLLAHFPNSPLTKHLSLFSENSANVFFSLLWAYLASQPLLKFPLIHTAFFTILTPTTTK
jgi:hypothetical protein